MTGGSDPPCHPERSEGSEADGRDPVTTGVAKDLKYLKY